MELYIIGMGIAGWCIVGIAFIIYHEHKHNDITIKDILPIIFFGMTIGVIALFSYIIKEVIVKKLNLDKVIIRRRR